MSWPTAARIGLVRPVTPRVGRSAHDRSRRRDRHTNPAPTSVSDTSRLPRVGLLRPVFVAFVAVRDRDLEKGSKLLPLAGILERAHVKGVGPVDREEVLHLEVVEAIDVLVMR